MSDATTERGLPAASAAFRDMAAVERFSDQAAACSLLLITWYFPPDNAVAAIRLGKMARFLSEAGHRVRIFTPIPTSEDRSLGVEVDQATITRTAYLDLDRRLNPANRSSLGADPTSEAGHALGRRVLRPIRRLLGRLYRDVFFYPDKRIDWSFTLIPALFRSVREDRPDVILVSGPPFSAFLSAALAGWWFDIPWIAEFRDRWVDDPYSLQPRWRRWFDGRMERFLVRRAAGIVTVSDVWSRFYAGKYGLPVETVMNGFDPRDFSLDIDPSAQLPLRLLHAGTIYPGRRDPSALFEAIRRHAFDPEELRLQFYGRELGTIRALADRMGVGAFVEIGDAVPYKEAIALQKRADVLLLMQWNDPADEGNVPAKIFEYLATNRQILGLGPLEGVPARLVRERNAGLFSNDPDEIARTLRAWIEEKRKTGRVTPPSRATSAGLDREAQYRRLRHFCRTVHGEESGRREAEAGRGRGPSAISMTVRSPHFQEITLDPQRRPVLTAIIDTEADFDWKAPFSRDAHGTGSMRHQQRSQRLFDRYGIKPTYLIDYPIATDPSACRVLRGFLDEGRADVGIQLHPWTNPPFDELLSTRNSYPSNLPKALQRAKIERLIEAVRRHLGIEPKVFKAGRYGFNDDTALLLEEFGLEIDTSVVPFTDFRPVGGPNFQGSPPRPFWFGQERPLLELPVTRNLCGLLGERVGEALLPWIQGRLGNRCHLPGLFARAGLLDRLTLTPEGMPLPDLKRLTQTLTRRGERLFTFVFHSPSVAAGNTPYVRNEEDLQAFLARIERFLRFFTEELGGEGRSALELRDHLLPSRASAHHPSISVATGTP